VMTFDSFVYRYAVAPYVKTISKHFGVPLSRLRGITLKDPPVLKRMFGGRPVIKPQYPKDDILHYIDKNGDFYVANLCELVMTVKKGRDSLVKKISSAVSLFWNRVFVDEFQDFRQHDYGFLIEIAKKTGRLTMVGDYYQHSVLAEKVSGKPFKGKKGEVSYGEFIEILRGQKIEVDVKTLNSSRRCPECVCSFVHARLGIAMTSSSSVLGFVRVLDAESVDKVMRDDTIVKLVWQNAKKKPYRANNWSYSKGDTYEKVCVILTEKTDSITESMLDIGVGAVVRNRLYVALTRASSELYILPSGVHSCWEKATKHPVCNSNTLL